MGGSLEKRTDGSAALFINGDLQFDSHDEFIYHEALVIPALKVAESRSSADLRVLVVGGGDGLAARELFKSPRVASIDLVDYDPEILALARRELLELNKSSLLDSRITTHVKDAWEFADELLERGATFDLIVCDLTVAEDIQGARFHSVDWYDRVCRLLTKSGVVAVNGVSPQATPKAYWSIFNGMLRSGLHPRPYHAHIPSFSNLGYGSDWGFFIASPKPIAFSEIEQSVESVVPRKLLKDLSDIQKLFVLPEETFAFQSDALPALAGSDIILRYFKNSGSPIPHSGLLKDSFSLDTFNMATPEPDSGCDILSPELSAALAASIFSNQNHATTQPQDVQLILDGVLNLVPSLEKEHTSELIADFLERPDVVLRAIDLPGLVSRLLKRASELPASLVSELEHLRDSLEEWKDDHATLLSLGSRIVTVLSLVIIIGNVLFPDMAYAKGGHEGGDHGAHHDGARAGAGHAGRRDRVGGVGGGRAAGYYGGRYWDGTTWIENRKILVPSKNLKNSLPQSNDVSDAGDTIQKDHLAEQSGVKPTDTGSDA